MNSGIQLPVGKRGEQTVNKNKGEQKSELWSVDRTSIRTQNCGLDRTSTMTNSFRDFRVLGDQMTFMPSSFQTKTVPFNEVFKLKMVLGILGFWVTELRSYPLVSKAKTVPFIQVSKLKKFSNQKNCAVYISLFCFYLFIFIFFIFLNQEFVTRVWHING